MLLPKLKVMPFDKSGLRSTTGKGVASPGLTRAASKVLHGKLHLSRLKASQVKAGYNYRVPPCLSEGL